jgi:hypothetical protein
VEYSTLVGKSIRTFWVFRSEGVHPAWIDSNTLPIAAFGSVLEFTDGSFATIGPCEVPLPDQYPALGLSLEFGSSDSLNFVGYGGGVVHATRLEEAEALVPFLIDAIDTSDPLGEDSTSQYLFRDGSGASILFRHMMPPMTLGILVHVSSAAA